MTASQLKIARILLTLSFFWVLNCCSYQHPPLQPAPEEPPAPVEVKPETAVAVHESSALVPPTAAEPEPRFHAHNVRWPGETLSVIAKWYTGTVKNWKALANANPTLNPKKIVVGDTILIPENLLTSRKPMPFSFLKSSGRKKDIRSSSSIQTSVKSDSPKLFGPVESDQTSTTSDSPKLFGPAEPDQTSTTSDAIELFSPIE